MPVKSWDVHFWIEDRPQVLAIVRINTAGESSLDHLRDAQRQARSVISRIKYGLHEKEAKRDRRRMGKTSKKNRTTARHRPTRKS